MGSEAVARCPSGVFALGPPGSARPAHAAGTCLLFRYRRNLSAVRYRFDTGGRWPPYHSTPDTPSATQTSGAVVAWVLICRGCGSQYISLSWLSQPRHSPRATRNAAGPRCSLLPPSRGLSSNRGASGTPGASLCALGAGVPLCGLDARLPQGLRVRGGVGWRWLFVSFGETSPLPSGQSRGALVHARTCGAAQVWLLRLTHRPGSHILNDAPCSGAVRHGQAQPLLPIWSLWLVRSARQIQCTC